MALSMSRDQRLRLARIVSLVASMLISLAAGTNYVYSAYAPQLGERLHLSAKEVNVVGTFGNLGMYLAGIPSGMIVDNKGPRPPILFGAVCLFCGYYPIHLAMIHGLGSLSVPSLCFFSGLTGVGSCFAFGGALKMAALNWPHHRGSATAVALAAFGLSAFFFSSLSSYLYPGNSEEFLRVLATATSGICFICFFFCRVVPVTGAYSALPIAEPEEPSNRLHRSKSHESKRSSIIIEEPGTTTHARHPFPAGSSNSTGLFDPEPNPDPNPNESSSLFSKSSSSCDEEENRIDIESHLNVHDHVIPDISGRALMASGDFWLLFTIMACLAGTGLMTINNVGSDARALWAAYDPTADPDFVHAQQGLHVSILSICSFLGRIISGTSSDLLIKRYGFPRHILLATSASLFVLGQLFALTIENPSNLWLVSSLNGLGYGALFGVAPTIISEAFGVRKMSTNWGALTIAAVVGGNVTNLMYGKVFDDHSRVHGVCEDGLLCYRNAYVVSLMVSTVGLLAATSAIWIQARRNAAAAMGRA